MFTNKYIFIYASVMVIIVAAILSSAAQLLKPYQERNIRTEKIMDILKAVNIDATKQNAEKLYNKYIIDEYILNPEGDVTDIYSDGKFVKGDTRAFDINMKEELSREADYKSGKSQIVPEYPLFVCKKEGKTYYIVPLRGKGLWGPIWGNIAFEDDFRTVYGVTFGDKGETPGLGAEIATEGFQHQFFGKTIFDKDYNFTSIKVVKGGVESLPEKEQIHGVDAVSGGTITSKGVSAMLQDCLEDYEPYIKKNIVNQSGNESKPAA